MGHYVYIKSEPGLWTVGFYDPQGRWLSESDHNNTDNAASRVAWLNGGGSTPPKIAVESEKVDWTHLTTTSSEILKGLKEADVDLSIKNKQLIIEKVYEAIVDAYNYKRNGCDCGQVHCPICG